MFDCVLLQEGVDWVPVVWSGVLTGMVKSAGCTSGSSMIVAGVRDTGMREGPAVALKCCFLEEDRVDGLGREKFAIGVVGSM